MDSNGKANRPLPVLLSTKEVADLLDCSIKTVYRLRDAGRIPAPLHIGRDLRWRLDRLQTWIDRGCPDCRVAFRK
jgi:excisionase family DNA binding protein